jgi:uncharacterized membrane protein
MYVYTGQYGDIEKIGLGNSVLIVMQLTFSGFLIVMIDEMMNKVFFCFMKGIWIRKCYFFVYCHKCL